MMVFMYDNEHDALDRAVDALTQRYTRNEIIEALVSAEPCLCDEWMDGLPHDESCPRHPKRMRFRVERVMEALR